MTRQRDDDGGPRTGGRSGNDYLARGGEGYQSWAAEGPSGTAAEGGPPADVPSLQETAAWHTPATAETRRGSEGGSGLFPLLVGVGVGAALMYFLDRDRGAERRQHAAGLLGNAVKSGQRAAEGAVASVRARVTGGNGASAESAVPRGSTATVVADVEDPLDAGRETGGGAAAR